MQFGLCTGIDGLAVAEKAGFDYIEPPVANLMPDKPEPEFQKNKAQALSGRIQARAFNCFIPGNLKVTGPDADLEALKAYVESAARRAASIGADVIVFGSGGARRVQDGFPVDDAMKQVQEFLRAIAPIAADARVTIAIEPLNRRECNIINSVNEGCDLARQVNHPAVKALADLYHIGQESESYENTSAAGSLLAHVHIAHPATRHCPLPDDGCDYGAFFRALKAAHYSGRISFECGWDDLTTEAPISLDYLRKEWARA